MSLAPVLVYNRIEGNRRKTKLLLASFALALLPVVSGAAVFLMPFFWLIGGAIMFAIQGMSLAATVESVNARITSASADPTNGLLGLPPSYLLVFGGILALALIAAVLMLVGVISFLIFRYGSRMVLRLAGAQLVDPLQEPDLVRTVENLCIGAGLHTPDIYVVESTAPNALATGRDAQHASLVVTRGLLTLLDRRELEGVVAHELSHIGNNDIRLSTVLAALVGTMTMPFRMCAAPVRWAFAAHWGIGIVASFIAFQFVLMQLVALRSLFQELPPDTPAYFSWWIMHATISPIYAVFVAPLLALLIRQALSQQREFLADADAVLLTRDPEGLALALVKIGTAKGEGLRVGESIMHLYFVDPAQEGATWLHGIFPSHPPLEKRIALLTRMGNGIAPAALEEAREAGAKIRQIQSKPVALEPAPPPDGETPATVESLPSREAAGTPLYERPDGWSGVLAQLPPDAVVTSLGHEGSFIRVVTKDKVVGYVSQNGLRIRLAKDASAGPA
jgi:heat shock protein HtpX